VASQKNILEYLCSEKKIHNAINEGWHIDFYGPNVDSLLHSSISLYFLVRIAPRNFGLIVLPRAASQIGRGRTEEDEPTSG
jgi:hypothetical protein